MKTLAMLPLLLLTACYGNEPNYYIRPGEMQKAEEMCAGAGGLVGLGVVVMPMNVTYVAVCRDGERRWKK